MNRRLLFGVTALVVALGLIAWVGIRFLRAAPSPIPESSPASIPPVTRIKRGDVTVAVSAKGELQGGNSEMITAPITGGGDSIITYLPPTGELVRKGDVIVKFDTTDQDFKLKEAEADLAEAEQQVIQSRAEGEAKLQETRYLLLQAQADVRLAELDVRRNPLLAAITARQNTLALEAAREKQTETERTLQNLDAAGTAGVAIQEAARNKAEVKAESARKNIESMTLRAKSSGYVNIQQNTQGNFNWGTMLPVLQVGDTVRAGMAVAQIPDLKDWEIVARIGELDRGHIEQGQKASITIVALPDRSFSGRVKEIGGTTGPPWNRRFECKLTIENATLGLRPGMSANLVITTGIVRDALWAPSQALFESDGRTFVYAESPSGFVPHDVKLIRRSESQVALTGITEGQVVALASPEQQKQNTESGGAMKALSR